MTLVVTLSAWLLTASPCLQAVPLAQGDTSPCEGVLVPAADALAAVRCARVHLPECRVRLEGADAELEIKLDAAAQREDELLDRIARADAAIDSMSAANAQLSPWWDSPALWAGAGVAVGVGVTLAILKATAASR